MDCGLGADRAGSLELRRRRARPRAAGARPTLAARRVEDVARAAQIVVVGGGSAAAVGAAAGAVDAVDAVAAVAASLGAGGTASTRRGLGLGLRGTVRRVDADDGFVGDREDVGDEGRRRSRPRAPTAPGSGR